jgi:hypothetical protein
MKRFTAIELKRKMDNALLFSDSFSVILILDTYRSDRFMIVKLVGEHEPS